jgi:hypothetical protein
VDFNDFLLAAVCPERSYQKEPFEEMGVDVPGDHLYVVNFQSLLEGGSDPIIFIN